MKTKLTTLILLSIFLFSCTTKKNFNKKISSKHAPTELQKDLEIVKSSLENNHPGVYWYINKRDLDFKFDSLKNSLTDSLTSIEFYRKLAPVVAAVKCGHTRLFYPGLKYSKFEKDSLKKSGKLPLYQYDYFVDSNRLFIKSTLKKGESDSLKRAEVLAINEVPVSEIIEKCESLFSSDGYNQTFYRAVLNKSFSPYYYLSYPKADSIKLDLRLNDSTFNYVLKKIKAVKETKKISTPEEVGKKKSLAKQTKKLNRKNRYKGKDEFGKPFLDLKYDSLANSTAIMTVKSFAFPNANFHKFFRESFNELKEKNIDHLILDVRNNGGGSLLACNRLFRYLYNQPWQFTGKAYTKNSYLKPIKYQEKSAITKILELTFYPVTVLSKLIFEHKDSLGYYSYIPTAHEKKPLKNVYNGDLKVLINGYSFSATSLLSANLQSVKRGTFIGEETGGGYNQCTAGKIPFVNLPNTGLKLRQPLKLILIIKKRELYGRGVFPDIVVKEKFENVLEKRDVFLEEAK